MARKMLFDDVIDESEQINVFIGQLCEYLRTGKIMFLYVKDYKFQEDGSRKITSTVSLFLIGGKSPIACQDVSHCLHCHLSLTGIFWLTLELVTAPVPEEKKDSYEPALMLA